MSKVLTFKQPWAELVLRGLKTIDIRRRNTKFRGDFLIHSSMAPDMSAMRRFGFEFEDLLHGYILGQARLVRVKQYHSTQEFLEDEKLHLATFDFGKFGLVLESIVRVEPIQIPGNLGFWNYNGEVKYAV